MARLKCSEIYITSTVSVPRDEKHRFKGMTIDENTSYLDYIQDRLQKDPSILIKRPLLKSTINFKARKSHEEVFKQIQEILSKYNISFSRVFRILYDDYVQSKDK